MRRKIGTQKEVLLRIVLKTATGDVKSYLLK